MSTKKVTWWLWDVEKENAVNIKWIRNLKIQQHHLNQTYTIIAIYKNEQLPIRIKEGFLTKEAAQQEIERLLDGRIK